MPCLWWEQLYSIFCKLCIDKGVSLNLDLMVHGNYVVFMIMLMSIYVYMYACMYVISDRVIIDHDCFMLMFICLYVCMYVIVSQDHDCLMLIFICIYMYVYLLLSDRVVRNHSYGGIITYAGE